MSFILENFILGLIFILVLQPVLDSFTSLSISFIEMIKSYFNVVITRNNEKITNRTSKATIGFKTEEGEVEDCDL